MSAKRVVLMEFNELCPPLMERWMAEGKLPNFARFHREAAIHVTESDEDAPYLEPWIQWITVHCGIPYKEHQIHDLGDGFKLREKNVWDLLSDEGHDVWVCGSMNVSYQRPLKGWVLPDPWMSRVKPFPADELRPYFRFVSANVQEYTRDESPLSLREKAEFVAFMARHGLSAETAIAIVRQLASERMAKTHWKRAVILDRLQFDLFRWRWKRAQPSFATFFLNSTAHFQHLYWRHMEPELFQVKPKSDELSVYANAILYGYQEMDRLVGRFMELAGDDVTLVFLTALSQQPCLEYEAQGGKTIYRPKDFTAFLRAVGITAPAQVAPVMAHQFHLDFETEDAARDAETKLAALQFAGRGQAVRVERKGKSIFGGCRVFEHVKPDAIVTVVGSDRTIPFFDLFYHLDLVKSGMHHPDGMMWIRTPERRHLVNSDKVPLVAVAPTILEMFGVKKPGFMKGEPITRTLRRAA
jgi:hypothetical protein